MLAQTLIHISDLVMTSAMTLDERMVDIISQSGGRNSLNKEVQIYDIHNFNGFSGHNYWVDGVLIGQLHLASLTNGNYALYKRVFLEGEITEIYDYYDQNGQFLYASNQLEAQVVQYNSINMDPTSPLVNHIYNILNHEYEQAKTGQSFTRRITYLESVLKSLMMSDKTLLSVTKVARDQAIINIDKEILRIEKDPVLRWDERQAIYSSLKELRAKIIKTKKRAHRINGLKYSLPLMAYDLKTKFLLFKQRPTDNMMGTSYKYTLGKMIWFVKTVKDNLGYSVALAIYGPFTFYFITQPMNPHAMWAVGKVRNAYIETVSQVENIVASKTTETMIANKQIQDEVTTSQAAIAKIPELPKASISWDERMSNFKAMQISYEGNMVFAARMGRIEQMETQFSFSLTAESAWQEMERYLRSLEATLTYNTNLDSRFKTFLEKEIQRTQQLQVYIWKKMGQYFLDFPYIVVDESNEQDQKDYYVGRAFIFMQEMTEKLSQRNLDNMPATHAKVQELAKRYAQMKKQGGSVLDSLKKNSKLFQQKDLYNTAELRTYMKRHWEVLFLQQNKAQEASSFGLQTYTWSIKNAIWGLQSIYSAKREELPTLAYKFNLNNQATAGIKSDKAVDDILEQMMHMLTLEYVSIKEEFAKNMKNDDETVLREELLNNLKMYLSERDKLYNSTLQVANNNSSDANTI